MPTRNYSMVMNVQLGTDRELGREERYRLRKAITLYLNREFKLNIAVDHASNGQVRITGPARFCVPR